jgi:3'(2'), 5'-bisphosphate nucleotidase
MNDIARLIDVTRRNDLARTLAEIAAEAGVELSRIQACGCSSKLKSDGSPVSDADMAAEAIISARLRAAFPDIPVISEENAASHETDGAECFFLVDPLDGTKAFLAGAPDFCVLIALVAHHLPIASAIHAPASGQSWWAGQTGFSAQNRQFSGVKPLERHPTRAGGQIAIVSSQHAGGASRDMCDKLGIIEVRCENSALKFARLAEGKADIYPRLGRTMQWDVAAGDALLRAMGGGVFDLQGQPLRYGPGANGWANPEFIAIRAQPEPSQAG